jgi:hypothetical protein
LGTFSFYAGASAVGLLTRHFSRTNLLDIGVRGSIQRPRFARASSRTLRDGGALRERFICVESVPPPACPPHRRGWRLWRRGADAAHSIMAPFGSTGIVIAFRRCQGVTP